MKLYNSLTRTKQELVPIDKENIRIYTCGPTVYNFFHIGNARCFVIFDFLRRYLEYCGHKVTFVQNFTDIDDKMIKRANEEGTTVRDVADKYIAEYFTDAQGLGVRKATVHPRATENIAEIIEIVKTLEDGGYAYSVYPEGESENKDVYFSTKKFKTYGKLSHMPMDEIENGARIGVSEIKNDPVDFALWKAAKPGEPYWDSPWGKGRPGWHIECTAMAKKYLGSSIDIHCGGQDLTFPHHENEIAQSEAYDSCCGNDGTVFSQFWVHNGYINIDGAKMSKSGTFFTVRDAAAVYGYDAIRFFLISAHYRSPVNYSNEALEAAKASLERLHACYDNLLFTGKNAKTKDITEEEKEALSRFAQRKVQMCEALDNDLNTADAVSAIFELTKDINVALTKEVSSGFCEKAFELYNELLTLFGFEKKEVVSGDEAQIEELIQKRTDAKKNKDYALADSIREELKNMGIILEDTPLGVKWRRQ